MRQCPCCKKVISGHPNKKFCNNKCKDRHHNQQPHRIERSRMIEGTKSPMLAMIERAQSRHSISIDPEFAGDDLEAKAECAESGCMGCPDCMDWDEDDY